MAKKFLKFSLRLFLILIGFIALYLILAFTLPYITVNNSYKDTEPGIKIFVLSNGVHTDLVVPAKNEFKDWTITFPKDSFGVMDDSYSFIAFGWGDKGFYLYTPEWSDLKASTAFKAACGLGGTAMHVRYLKERKTESEKCETFTISPDHYKNLIKFIGQGFEKNDSGFIKINHPGYGNFDRFYEANGNYSLFKTCNVWTNNRLKEIGIKTGCWTPFSAGLMRSVKH